MSCIEANEGGEEDKMAKLPQLFGRSALLSSFLALIASGPWSILFSSDSLSPDNTINAKIISHSSDRNTSSGQHDECAGKLQSDHPIDAIQVKRGQ